MRRANRYDRQRNKFREVSTQLPKIEQALAELDLRRGSKVGTLLKEQIMHKMKITKYVPTINSSKSFDKVREVNYITFFLQKYQKLGAKSRVYYWILDLLAQLKIMYKFNPELLFKRYLLNRINLTKMEPCSFGFKYQNLRLMVTEDKKMFIKGLCEYFAEKGGRQILTTILTDLKTLSQRSDREMVQVTTAPHSKSLLQQILVLGLNSNSADVKLALALCYPSSQAIRFVDPQLQIFRDKGVHYVVKPGFIKPLQSLRTKHFSRVTHAQFFERRLQLISCLKRRIQRSQYQYSSGGNRRAHRGRSNKSKFNSAPAAAVSRIGQVSTKRYTGIPSKFFYHKYILKSFPRKRVRLLQEALPLAIKADKNYEQMLLKKPYKLLEMRTRELEKIRVQCFRRPRKVGIIYEKFHKSAYYCRRRGGKVRRFSILNIANRQFNYSLRDEIVIKPVGFSEKTRFSKFVRCLLGFKYLSGYTAFRGSVNYLTLAAFVTRLGVFGSTLLKLRTRELKVLNFYRVTLNPDYLRFLNIKPIRVINGVGKRKLSKKFAI